MLELLSSFVCELRSAGLPVSVTEHLDASRAVHHVPLEDRAALKVALGTTLVKSGSHWPTFEAAFDVYFAPRTGTGTRTGADGSEEDGASSSREGDEYDESRGPRPTWSRARDGGATEAYSAQELAAMLMRAIQGGDAAMARLLARHAVDRYAGMEPGRPVGGTYYLYRTLRSLDLEGLLEGLLDAHRSADPDGITPLDERLLADEYRARIAALRREIESEIRNRLVADRGVAALARSVRRTLPEDVDVMHASREELAQLQRALHPLARRLAARLGRKRRHHRKGPLDFRATVRRSLSTGGVPVEPRFRHPRPSKPEIFVIADISGSVASFARFTLQLVYAVATQFTKVRSFVFVDGIDEVTNLLDGADDPVAAVQRVAAEADVVWMDGHSDYGHALAEFDRRWGDGVTPRATVIVLGDARNNYHASGAWVLAQLQHRARHVYWLNPEPRQYWGSGDSIVDEYAVFCDAVVECRTLRQLERFVAELA